MNPAILGQRLRALADELSGPLECHSPAYGVPGHVHCAACCYGTGYVVTCDEEQMALDTANQMRLMAALLSGEALGVPPQ